MKKIPFIIALSLSSCVPSYAGYIADSTKEKILHAVAVLQEDNKVIRQKLDQASVDLATSEAETKAVQLAADKLKADRDWYKADDAAKDSVITAKDKIIAEKNHKLSWIGFLLATAVAGLFFISTGELSSVIMGPMLPYLLGGRIVVTGILFTSVLAWVRYF